jgi:hypothetical protein
MLLGHCTGCICITPHWCNSDLLKMSDNPNPRIPTLRDALGMFFAGTGADTLFEEHVDCKLEIPDSYTNASNYIWEYHHYIQRLFTTTKILNGATNLIREILMNDYVDEKDPRKKIFDILENLFHDKYSDLKLYMPGKECEKCTFEKEPFQLKCCVCNYYHRPPPLQRHPVRIDNNDDEYEGELSRRMLEQGI